MGLIKAGMGALGGTLADQWKEFFYCDALDKDVLMVKGQKRTFRRSSNHGEDNIITNGSGIAVADGQCMLIVEQGKVVEVCAEPGEYTFNSSTEPSVFTGNFGDSLAATFQTVAKRFTYGGDTGKDQRVYYINTKELGEILYGTATPIPFRVVVSEERGYKLSVNIRCNGSFTYRICDPLLFYTNVCSNVSTQYDASELAPRLKSELMNALQPALATLSANKVQYYEIPAHTLEISDALNEQLSNIWRKKRGIEVFSFNINSLSIPEEQQKKITEWEENAMTTDAREGHPYDVDNMPKEPFSIVYLGVALVIGLITALIVTGVMKSRLKSVAPQRDATSYVRQGSMKLTNQRDLYLYREVHRTERPKESSSSDSGGSSTHTSSSGSTHGGGGGSF